MITTCFNGLGMSRPGFEHQTLAKRTTAEANSYHVFVDQMFKIEPTALKNQRCDGLVGII